MSKEQYPFLPIGTQLLLKELDAKEITTEGGVIIPEQIRRPINQGEIVAKGFDVPIASATPELTEVQAFDIGNIVVFPMHSDTRFQMNKKTYIIVDYTQVILSDYGFFRKSKISPV